MAWWLPQAAAGQVGDSWSWGFLTHLWLGSALMGRAECALDLSLLSRSLSPLKNLLIRMLCGYLSTHRMGRKREEKQQEKSRGRTAFARRLGQETQEERRTILMSVLNLKWGLL
jgi:hypothetical protein